MTQPTKTRSEQYSDAIDRAKKAIDTDDLEMALQCINAALWVERDLETHTVLDDVGSETSTDMNFGDSLGSPCAPDGAVDLLIDYDEIKYNVDAHQFGYIR